MRHAVILTKKASKKSIKNDQKYKKSNCNNHKNDHKVNKNDDDDIILTAGSGEIRGRERKGEAHVRRGQVFDWC